MPYTGPFFDLHCHPSFKALLGTSDFQNARPLWDTIDVQLGRPLPLDWILELFLDVLDSQSSGDQLLDGNVRLVVLNLYALENAYANTQVIKLLDGLSEQLNNVYLDRVRQGTVSYAQLILESLRHLATSEAPIVHNGRQYRVIHDMQQYRPAAEPKTLFFLLAMEGGHGFYPAGPMPTAADDPAILAEVHQFKQPTQRLLYVTMTHHAQNHLANHAFAVPEMFSGNGLGTGGAGGFNPVGTALTDSGQAFVKTCLDTSNGAKRILIDVKHLSWGARQELYATWDNAVPLVASHVGVTGLTAADVRFVDWVKEFADDPRCLLVKYKPLDTVTYEARRNFQAKIPFNPWSINLFNEDILAILASKGLIGISLDKRVLGYGNPGNERFSKTDLTPAVKRVVPLTNPLVPAAPLPRSTPQDRLDEFIAERQPVGQLVPLPPSGSGRQPEFHTDITLEEPRYFCNNILHVAKVGLANGHTDVWDRMCLGSDFDGLISAIRFREISLGAGRTADRLPVLARTVERHLTELTRKSAAYQNIAIPAGFMAKLFHDNAVEFLKKHF